MREASRSHGPPWERISVHQATSVQVEKSQMNKQLAVWVTTEDRGNQKNLNLCNLPSG